MDTIYNILIFFVSIENYTIGIASGIISSVLVTQIYKKEEVKKNTRLYLIDLKDYMAQVSTAINFYYANETVVWYKLYDIPKTKGPVKIGKKFNQYLQIHFEIMPHIEVSYQNYILSKKYLADGDLKYKEDVERDKEALEVYAEKFRIASNNLSFDLGFLKCKKVKKKFKFHLKKR